MNQTSEGPVSLSTHRARTDRTKQPTKTPTSFADHNTHGGRRKAGSVFVVREDGLCTSRVTMLHTHVQGHEVEMAPIDSGWGGLCVCGRVAITDTEGEIRRWGEMHLGAFRPMRPN